MSDTSPAGGSADATHRPRNVDAHEFPGALRDAVAESDLVLVDFYTNGCSICQSIEPVLGGVARNAAVPILLVNPRDDPQLVSDHTIRSVPTLALFEADDDGDPVEVGRLADGFVGADRLAEFVESHR
ncbi:thioredoxin family protein [Halobaculum halobium]|uniref:Thioredoxin family protein n=1 Tax=Halobaculum halobium TaxID=3032281 RepID=A0ABD5T9C9_9EURY|nr:thioredoxin family protein [Halobaculum sp. SYNS20]